MAYQFQSVATLSPLIAHEFGVSLADIGLLIGLYLAPGVIVAIPGGAIAARFGDKRIVSLGMLLMLIGGALISFGPGWGALLVGRVLAGTGGVVLNIVMTKMLVDWFIGREISTAMAIFVNSWPIGIALSLVTLPLVAEMGGLGLAWGVVLALIAVGLALFTVFYRTPENAAGPTTRIRIAGLPVAALVLAALVWSFYNGALSMVFSFGPALLNQLGWSLASASTATSIFMIVFSVSLPLGGILADRTGRRDTIIIVSLLSYAILMPLVPYVPAWGVSVIFVVVGAFFGLAAGPIMTLPSVVLSPDARAFGMGVFFTVQYALMMVAPALAGKMADWTGNIGVVLILGAVMVVVGMVSLGFFRFRATVPAVAAE